MLSFLSLGVEAQGQAGPAEEQEVGFETHLWRAEESECETGTDQQGSQPLCLQAAGACLPQTCSQACFQAPEDF